MASAKKTCRVCGKLYEACRSAKQEPGVFYYKEVACSPECGAEYLRRVTQARKGPSVTQRPYRNKRKEDEAVREPMKSENSDKYIDEPAGNAE